MLETLKGCKAWNRGLQNSRGFCGIFCHGCRTDAGNYWGFYIADVCPRLASSAWGFSVYDVESLKNETAHCQLLAKNPKSPTPQQPKKHRDMSGDEDSGP